MWHICRGILFNCKEEANLDKYCVISLICGILKKDIHREAESRSVIAKVEVGCGEK